MKVSYYNARGKSTYHADNKQDRLWTIKCIFKVYILLSITGSRNNCKLKNNSCQWTKRRTRQSVVWLLQETPKLFPRDICWRIWQRRLF